MLSEMLPESDEELTALAAMERRWGGEPTKRMIRKLRDEVRTPNFDFEAAGRVLAVMGEGHSLRKAAGIAGVPGSVVRAWGRLEPTFGALLAQAETDLGRVWAEKAGDELERGDDVRDPAVARAMLALAATYDKTLKGGDSEVNVAQGITVTVQKFSSPD
jgi:hypothetical protein